MCNIFFTYFLNLKQKYKQYTNLHEIHQIYKMYISLYEINNFELILTNLFNEKWLLTILFNYLDKKEFNYIASMSRMRRYTSGYDPETRDWVVGRYNNIRICNEFENFNGLFCIIECDKNVSQYGPLTKRVNGVNFCYKFMDDKIIEILVKFNFRKNKKYETYRFDFEYEQYVNYNLKKTKKSNDYCILF